jgi:transketolase
MNRGQDQKIEQEEVDIQKLIMMCNEALKEGKPERDKNE